MANQMVEFFIKRFGPDFAVTPGTIYPEPIGIASYSKKINAKIRVSEIGPIQPHLGLSLYFTVKSVVKGKNSNNISQNVNKCRACSAD